MRLTHLLTAAAATSILCPALALAADAPPAAAPPPAAAVAAAPAPPPAALPSIPKIAPGANLYETLQASGQFTILLKAIDSTGLAPVLKAYPITLFAPTDAAFNALPPDQLARLTASGDAAANQLQQILKYDLINAQVDNGKIQGAKGAVGTVEGSTLLLDGSDPNDLKANGADIIQGGVRAANGGILYAIDKVVIPPDSPYYAALGAAQAPAAPAASASAPAAATTP